MEWTGKRTKSAETTGGGYDIRRKRNGKFYVEASMVGGAEVRLPYNEFETQEAAMAWADEREHKAAEKRAKRGPVRRIQF